MWLQNWISDGESALRLRTDLPYFAKHCLKLRTKSGAVEPFILNPAQLRLHALLEEQRAKTGRVRAVILKARQMGISSYISARLFHKTIHTPGVRTLIAAHERRASTNLYQIVRRYYDNLPAEMKPEVGTSNAEELIFDKLDSGYLITTASGEGTGRSATVQLMHLSELAYFEKLEDQFSGLVQTVPDVPGSEILIESTAFGLNPFYKLWRQAVAGESDFQAIFLPWSVQSEYRRPVGDNFKMDDEEKQFAELHNLDAAQINWRRAKRQELGERFQVEYPIDADQAFLSSSFDSFFSAEIVTQARRQKIEPHGPLIVGCDPAGINGDRIAIARRRGRCITSVEARHGLDTMQLSGLLAHIIKEEKPARIFIDIGGLGVGVFDRLVELGHKRTVSAVNFGSKPLTPPPYIEGRQSGGAANRRSELYSLFKAALEEGRFSLPDDDALQSDLLSFGYKFRSDGCLLLESKIDLKRRGIPSPDLADACALCFAEPDGSPYPRNVGFHKDLRDRYQGLYV